MNKRSLHHVWRYLRRVHPWYFLVLMILFGGLTLVSLRNNNEQMVKLRSAVYQADEQGGDVEKALRELRQYVYGHMNTSLASGSNAVHPPIQLKYTYERLQASQQKAMGQNNSALYGEAQKECDTEGQTATAQETINCIQDYTAARGLQLADIPDGLYKFDFVSAKWSPDLAGWSLVITVFSTVAFILTTLYRFAMKHLF